LKFTAERAGSSVANEREEIDMALEYIYSGYERFWHWAQAILISLLVLSGFEIHGTFAFFGFRSAVAIHNFTAITYLLLVVFTVFWHFTTGAWRQYIPTLTNLRAQMEFYLIGMFRDAAHPTRKHVLSKLNPLQRLVYAGLKLLVIPVMGTTGLLYMFYRYPQRHEVTGLNIGGLETVAILHTIGAFMLLAFYVTHIYLLTTGTTITSNLKAMLTGYEELPDGVESHGKSAPTAQPSQAKKG
jgi:thiosulfate reductase cytochrome b subunit